MLDVTPKQGETLTRCKTHVVKEVQTQEVDITTGELLHNKTVTTSIVGAEPDYIKVYYRTMLAFNGVNNVPLNFILALSKYITWTNDGEPMEFVSDRNNRDKICKDCNIKDQMCKTYLKRCIESQLLMPKEGYRGIYIVNPFFLAKGRWSSVSKLRTSFDYVDGKWVRSITTTTTQQGQQ